MFHLIIFCFFLLMMCAIFGVKLLKGSYKYCTVLFLIIIWRLSINLLVIWSLLNTIATTTEAVGLTKSSILIISLKQLACFLLCRLRKPGFTFYHWPGIQLVLDINLRNSIIATGLFTFKHFTSWAIFAWSICLYPLSSTLTKKASELHVTYLNSKNRKFAPSNRTSKRVVQNKAFDLFINAHCEI
jgi:hypothetical protein